MFTLLTIVIKALMYLVPIIFLIIIPLFLCLVIWKISKTLISVDTVLKQVLQSKNSKIENAP